MGMLDGKTVIVTGCAQGMGRRHAERCAEEGARVVATDLQLDAGRAAVAPYGDHAVFVEHDVTNPQGWDEVIRTTLDRFGSVDGLVNNAAIYHPPCLIDVEPFEDFERLLRVNVTGTWWGITKVIEPMRRAGGGSIVNISSIAGLRGIVGLSSYATTKWAVRGLTKSAANDLGPSGIRVNSVHPGGIAETGMYTAPQTEEERALRTGRVSLRRPGTVDEVSSVVLFLLSDASSYVTGVEHVVDGGSTLN
jgi:3alpha(or 20beta)-hydroxysteroid dehydrogenase